MKIISVAGARAPLVIPKEPVFSSQTGSLATPFIKSIHAVNTASSPLLGGDAGVRPEAQEAEGVNSIHAVNTASSLTPWGRGNNAEGTGLFLTDRFPCHTIPPRYYAISA